MKWWKKILGVAIFGSVIDLIVIDYLIKHYSITFFWAVVIANITIAIGAYYIYKKWRVRV